MPRNVLAFDGTDNECGIENTSVVRLVQALERNPFQMPASPASCLDAQHESLKWHWWPAEFFPMLRGGEGKRRRIAFGLGRHRIIKNGELISSCALDRLHRRADYRPPHLSTAFVDAVRQLPKCDGALGYAADGVLDVPRSQ